MTGFIFQPIRSLARAATLAAAMFAVSPSLAARPAPKLPTRFELAHDSADQPCFARRVYGDPLTHGPEQAYDMFCGHGGDAVGRVYLWSSAQPLRAWRSSLGPCTDSQPLDWPVSGLDSHKAVLCKGGQAGAATDDPGAPAEERVEAQGGGWVVAGNALPPAAASLDRATKILLGLSTPGATNGVANRPLMNSVISSLGGSVVGVSPYDYETLVEIGHESNTLSLYTQAETYFSQAIAAHRTFWPNDRIGEADLKLELALNLSNQRQFSQARRQLAEARAEAKDNAFELAKADLYGAEIVLNNVNDNTRLTTARGLLESARKRLDAAGPPPVGSLNGLERTQLLQALVWRTTAHISADNPALASQALQNAADSLNKVDAANDAWLRALIAKDRAKLELSAHHPQVAVSLLRAGISALDLSIPDSRVAGDLYVSLGQAEAAAGDVPAAIAAYKKAFSILNAQVEESGAAPDVAVGYINLLMGDKAGHAMAKTDPHAQEIFAAFEAVSSTAVRQTASAAAARLSSGPDAKLIRDWQDSQRATVIAAEALNRINGSQTATASEKAAAEHDLAVKTDTQSALARQVYVRQPSYAALAQGRVTLADTQTALQADDVLVRILVGGDGGVGLLVKKESVTPFRFDANASRVSSLVTQIKTSARHQNAFDLNASRELFEDLFGSVRAPLLDQPEKRMIIDAEGALAAIPFGVLATDAPDTANPRDFQHAKWLGQRFAMVVSAGLRPLRGAGGDFKTFVGYGDFTPLMRGSGKLQQVNWIMDARGLPATTCQTPLLVTLTNLAVLDGTAVELNAIKQNLDGDIHLGGEFRPERVINDHDLRKADLVVLATHGIFRQIGNDPDAVDCIPEAALLTSAPDGLGDMFLDTRAVLDLQLSAKLVILSACDTGNPVPVNPGETGLPSGGDALSGFARAFIYAGAQNVIVTHWPIRDKFGPGFMGDLTKALKSGAAPETALQTAQDEAISSGTYADPYYWGAFSLVSMGLKTQ